MLHRSASRILGHSLRQFTVLTQYTSETVGEGFDKRTFIFKDQKKISPWHHINLFIRGKTNTYNAIFEIQRDELAKMEVSTTEKFNPIKQDTKKKDGVRILREYAIKPIFNYGMLPQTWENQKEKEPKYGLFGDNDPLDVVEIGEKKFPTGTVVEVRVLGILCMIDQGEIDWKVLTINTEEFLQRQECVSWCDDGLVQLAWGGGEGIPWTTGRNHQLVQNVQDI